MIYIVGHKNPDTDSVISAIAYAKYKGEGYTPAILGELNSETKFVLEKFGVEKPVLLESANSDDRFILVDHNENTQVIDNLKAEQVLEIVDHHKMNISFGSPIYITTKPYGSTASLIAEKFLEEDKNIDKQLAGLLLSAILSDTVIFKSPTATEKDEAIAKILSGICDVNNMQEFGIELFKKKAEISTKTANQIINNDFKDFDFGGRKIGIGQIELIDASEIQKRKNEIMDEMDKVAEDGKYFAMILIVTDIMKEGSYFWIIDESGIVHNIFNITEENNYIQDVLSRKKQVVPVLQENLK